MARTAAAGVSGGPAPFVGRQREFEKLKQHLATASLVSLHGALGSGRTRLVTELASILGTPCTVIQCQPGDRASALRSRAERALRCMPGMLKDALTSQARVLVIDDIQHLRIDDATRLLAQLRVGPATLGRVAVVSRDPLVASAGSAIAELELQGLDAQAVGQLWEHLEDSYGKAHGVAAALVRTRGAPLALRREYARARFGATAWDLTALDAPVRAALEAFAIPRGPVALAAVATLVPGVDLEAALTTLLALQLVDSSEDGIVLHEVVRGDVLANLAPDDKTRLSGATAQLMASTALDSTGRTLAGQAGDGGSFGTMDQITRVREVVWHWLAAGNRDRAADALIADRELAALIGGAGEFESLLDALGDVPRRIAGSPLALSPALLRWPRALDPERTRALSALHIEIAVRGGRYTEASARASAAPSAVSPLLHAELTLASGDASTARRTLNGLITTKDPSVRARAVAMLAELELLAGKPDTAAALLALLGDPVTTEPLALARVHLATAQLHEFGGRVAAMRSALAHALGACKSVPVCPEASQLLAIIEARCAIGLAREGRLAEAVMALDTAAAAARHLDAVAVADEVLVARALVARRQDDSALAAALLQDGVRARRDRGDELAAIRAELDLAELEIVRGQPAMAAELASAAMTSSVRHELGHLAARGRAVIAAIALIELRLDAALPRLEELHGHVALDANSAAHVTVLLATARALQGQRAGAIELAQNAGGEIRDDVDRRLAAAEVALAAGDVVIALEAARHTAMLAEHAHRRIELASALVVIARLELARGDRSNARAAARRAVGEAAAAGLVRVRVQALLALCALARDDGSSTAASYAADAADLAMTAGLPVERLVAHVALDAVSGREAELDPSMPSTATMGPAALEGATQLLIDLGLTTQGPFRVIDAKGVRNNVAYAHPSVLRMADRALAIDGVHDVIWRHGNEQADLRRRVLLKPLLLLFALAPGKVFSKEEIVREVWKVEYHPIRHDPPLFTGIMRLRQLLGDDGWMIIRSTEHGYRFVPPPDFLVVMRR